MTDTEEVIKPKVLFVDDEVNVLKSVKRALFKLDVDLMFADSSEKALEIISKELVDVVVSDMKMPGMNGAQLLSKIAELQPHTFRVVLTGYADIESIRMAVNEGKAHRFLNKPWDNDELIAVIDEGTERCKLRTENEKLYVVTQTQNFQLKNVNLELEKKVLMRTRQIKQALTSIKRHNSALEKVLYNLVVINPDIDGQFARLVRDSALALANHLNLDATECHNIGFAALLCEIGLLGITPKLSKKAFLKMNYEEQKLYESQVEHAALILAPITDMENCVHYIANQFESLHNNLKDVPIGSRVVAICRDFWRYRLGRMLDEHLNEEDTLIEMRKHVGKKYDKAILSQFAEIAEQIMQDVDFGEVKSEALKPGMILKNDLFNAQQLLILPEDHVFTEESIAKLKQFEEGAGNSFMISVSMPKDDDEEVAAE
ncbi:MAG: response regulator [Pseudomonadota bacterium]